MRPHTTEKRKQSKTDNRSGRERERGKKRARRETRR
jgi:hypothetical protein